MRYSDCRKTYSLRFLTHDNGTLCPAPHHQVKWSCQGRPASSLQRQDDNVKRQNIYTITAGTMQLKTTPEVDLVVLATYTALPAGPTPKL